MTMLVDGAYAFEFFAADPDYDPQSLLVAYRDGVEVGRVGWLRDTGWRGKAGRISGIYVEKPFRRQRVATALWHMARTLNPHVHHSTTFTIEGRAWAQSLPDDAASLMLA